VARNRKRANQRRPRQPAEGADARDAGLPTATERSFAHGHDHEIEENGVADREEIGAPDPLEHATPDVELAEEQLQYGRPDEPEPDDEADDAEFEQEVEESIAAAGVGGGDGGDGDGRRGRRGRGGDGGGYDGGAGAGTVAIPAGRQVEARENLLTRLIGFLQGSWRELQRVQWPDRRQVMQATGVVIGFVIVAAAFLGAADWVAGKLVTFILK
jgi:preprotein translocase subunit SecE